MSDKTTTNIGKLVQTLYTIVVFCSNILAYSSILQQQKCGIYHECNKNKIELF